ncbi:Polyphosphoinositide phosphatase [Golovinomyces cichoracearum]|uniref:Polyphosphoinositide phosphatase n=1 Tax=Golovinomyces cichoracearum TaxID=62708 RepID=A0A420J686_9PEZI|nr:Polyphosphoinositide phosphatase [Golovinomyces cichoracearum]
MSADPKSCDEEDKDQQALQPPPVENIQKLFSCPDEDEEKTSLSSQQKMNADSGMKNKMRRKVKKSSDQGVCKIHRYTLYETATFYYVVGADVMDKKFKILKISRVADEAELVVSEDETIYSKSEMTQMLNAIDNGNKNSGGMKLRCCIWGLLGFIRFTGAYYMLIISKRSQKAMIGGHYIYSIDGTEIIPLTTGLKSRFKADAKTPEEARFLSILNNLDLTRSFYFSYSYDITRTLQINIINERRCIADGKCFPHDQNYNYMFVWNYNLLRPSLDKIKNTFDWCLPVIHGYIDQSLLSIYGRTVFITLIARRSRYFAGARFLKRGANDQGYVANDVETEQIVSDVLTTSFHAPGPRLYANSNYTSYVQHRGSIPLHWTQDNTGVTPKPPIELNPVDPFYSAAVLHFDDLFERYGTPLYVLNLVKSRERMPRESKLLLEFTDAINYLNQFLPADKKIIHKAWDMSRASKNRDQDVIGTLESIAEEVVTTTGFFHNGDGRNTAAQVQNGIARTNCIDCLDRTNAAQFVIGKRALGHQLRALGIITDTYLAYDTDTLKLFTHMYHDHGDTIAVQYGGSQLVNTMETYRKINQWTSQSRDMVESFKRYYNNSFLDGQRQEAYNLFLGNYEYKEGQPLLWELATDYYLHHTNPRLWSSKNRRSYIKWYTPEFLEKRSLPDYVVPENISDKPLSYFDDYWLEYYKPLSLSSLHKIYSYPGKMNSTLRYTTIRLTQGIYNLSPFTVRTNFDQEVKRMKKEAVIANAANNFEQMVEEDDNRSSRSEVTLGTKRISLQRWLQPIQDRNQVSRSIKDSPDITKQRQKLTAHDKGRAAQSTFTQVVHESLNPNVSAPEADDYAYYILHPQTLPLVLRTETPTNIDSEYSDYVNKNWQDIGAVKSLEDRELNGSGLEDMAEYKAFLTVAKNPLTVTEDDLNKKRYKAYKKWLMGKSLFKEQPID